MRFDQLQSEFAKRTQALSQRDRKADRSTKGAVRSKVGALVGLFRMAMPLSDIGDTLAAKYAMMIASRPYGSCEK